MQSCLPIPLALVIIRCIPCTKIYRTDLTGHMWCVRWSVDECPLLRDRRIIQYVLDRKSITSDAMACKQRIFDVPLVEHVSFRILHNEQNAYASILRTRSVSLVRGG